MKTILVDAVDGIVVEDGGSFKLFEAMHQLLEIFPNQKIILTNADDAGLKEYGLDKMPYEVFTLKHNPDKTDSQYFKLMLEHFRLQPEEVIYFEHNLAAVASAQSVGITSYQYDADKKDLAALKEFIKKNL